MLAAIYRLRSATGALVATVSSINNNNNNEFLKAKMISARKQVIYLLALQLAASAVAVVGVVAAVTWRTVEDRLEFGQLRSIVEQNSQLERDNLDKCVSIWQQLSAQVLDLAPSDPSLARSRASTEMLSAVLVWMHEAELGDESELELHGMYQILDHCLSLIEAQEKLRRQAAADSINQQEPEEPEEPEEDEDEDEHFEALGEPKRQLVDWLESNWQELCARKTELARQVHDLDSRADTAEHSRSLCGGSFSQLRRQLMPSASGESSGAKNALGQQVLDEEDDDYEDDLAQDTEGQLRECQRELMESEHDAYCVESQLRSELAKVQRARIVCEQELRHVHLGTAARDSARRFNQQVADEFKL